MQARIEELPAIITAGATLEDAREFVLDALREYLLSLVERDEPAISPRSSRREPLEIVLGAY